MEESDNRELLEIFLEEATDLLGALSATIVQWSKDLDSKTYFLDLKRDLHTLKGGARMVNQPALSALAHALESLCEGFLSGQIPVDKEAYDLVSTGYDRMNACIEALRKKLPSPVVEDLLEKFKQKNSGVSVPSGVSSAAPSGVSSEALTAVAPSEAPSVGVISSVVSSSDSQKAEMLKRQKPVLVMVVDDSKTIRTVTKHFLERHQFLVMMAEDGLEALEKIAHEKPDIILLDVEMPRMNGFEFAEKIRSMPEFAKIPIMMITYAAGEEQRKRAKGLGIEKFMSKPYLESDLLEWIGILLEN